MAQLGRKEVDLYPRGAGIAIDIADRPHDCLRSRDTDHHGGAELWRGLPMWRFLIRKRHIGGDSLHSSLQQFLLCTSGTRHCLRL